MVAPQGFIAPGLRALVRWLVLLLLVPLADAELLERQLAARDDAVAWLAEGPPGRLRIEALHAAGVDTYLAPSWHGQLAVPDDASPGGLARFLHAVGSNGYDPRAYPDPVRGSLDLQAVALANHDAVVATERAADLAWHLLALHALGLGDRDEVAQAGTLLASMQAGGFPCNQNDLDLDCTGFAVAALNATKQPFDRAAALDFIAPKDGVFGDDPNADTQAWGILAMRHAGSQVPPSSWRWLLDLQQPNGAFQHRPGDPGPDATWLFPTVDAVLALSDFPGPAWVDLTWNGTAVEEPGYAVTTREVDGRIHAHASGPDGHARIVVDAPVEPMPAPWVMVALLGAMLLRRGRPALRPRQTARRS